MKWISAHEKPPQKMGSYFVKYGLGTKDVMRLETILLHCQKYPKDELLYLDETPECQSEKGKKKVADKATEKKPVIFSRPPWFPGLSGE